MCIGLYVHMNEQRNPVLFRDDEREERKTCNFSLPARGLRASLPRYRQKETERKRLLKKKRNRKEKRN